MFGQLEMLLYKKAFVFAVLPCQYNYLAHHGIECSGPAVIRLVVFTAAYLAAGYNLFDGPESRYGVDTVLYFNLYSHCSAV